MSAKQEIALKLRGLTPQGDFLGGTVDIELKRPRGTRRIEIRAADASSEIVVNGQPRLPKGDYQITVTPAGVFAPKSQVVDIPAKGVVTVTVVIDNRREQETKRDVALILSGAVDNSFIVKGQVRGLDSSRLPNVTSRPSTEDCVVKRSSEKYGSITGIMKSDTPRNNFSAPKRAANILCGQ